jgi:oligopeptide transport system substrate-binding protein
MVDSVALNRRHLIAGGGALAIAACSAQTIETEKLLRVAISRKVDSFDPTKGQFASSALLYKQVHTPLTDYGPAAGVVPGLAQSWSSEDGRSWVFKLHEGLVWSDETPLTAHDVVWTAQRTVDPTTGFADQGDFFAVIGAREALRGEISPEEIAVTAPDDFTVIFEMDRPLGLFPVLMREFYPQPRHAIEAHGSDYTRPENWASCGPYLLSDQGAMRYRLAKNPSYRLADQVKVETIEVSVVEDAATRARLFRAGDLDLVDQPPTDQIAFFRERLGDQLVAFDAPILTYLKVNCTQPYLADPRVRKAISLCIDRARLVEIFFNAEGTPTDQIIPKTNPTTPTPDIDEARALLAAAGYDESNPLSITLRATAGDRERVAVAIVDDLRLAGIEAEVYATYPLDLYQAVDADDFDLALARFNRGLKSQPDFMIQPFTQDGFANNTNWDSQQRARFDTLIDEASGQVDMAERTRLLLEAESEFLAGGSSIPLLNEKAYWMVSDRVAYNAAIQPQMWRDLSWRPSNT